MDRKIGTGRWIEVYWESLFGQLKDLPLSAGRIVDGVLRIPPPTNDIGWSEGVWSEINESTGLMLDVGEDDILSPDQAHQMAKILERQICAYSKLPASDLLTADAALQLQPLRQVLPAEIEVGEFKNWLEMLRKFLAGSAVQQKSVVIAL